MVSRKQNQKGGRSIKASAHIEPSYQGFGEQLELILDSFHKISSQLPQQILFQLANIEVRRAIREKGICAKYKIEFTWTSSDRKISGIFLLEVDIPLSNELTSDIIYSTTIYHIREKLREILTTTKRQVKICKNTLGQLVSYGFPRQLNSRLIDHGGRLHLLLKRSI